MQRVLQLLDGFIATGKIEACTSVAVIIIVLRAQVNGARTQ